MTLKGVSIVVEALPHLLEPLVVRLKELPVVAEAPSRLLCAYWSY